MPLTRRDLLSSAAVGSVLIGTRLAHAAVKSDDPLLAGFRQPPSAARPRVWWHWMNGNITEEGIKLDLAWMKRVGIGGIQTFDAALATPQIVEKRLAYMTPEWKQAFRLAVDEAEQAGMEFAIAASPGWSETGGPWVPPADGMKKLVWARTDVAAGSRAPIATIAPPRVTGPFQDTLKRVDPIAARREGPPPAFYRDVAVLAYPVVRASGLSALATLSDGSAPSRRASAKRGFADAHFTVPFPDSDRSSWISYDFARPTRFRSATLALDSGATLFTGGKFKALLEASDDGIVFRPVAEFPVGITPQYTVAFAPVTVRHVRLRFDALPPSSLPFTPVPGAQVVGVGSLGTGAPAKAIAVDAFAIGDDPRVHRFEEKAGFEAAVDYYALESATPETGIDPDKVLDLTDRLREDGTLDWTPAAGDWTILRLGYALTGKENHPATLEATGLEVDKLDADAVGRYIDHYLGMYAEAVGADQMGKRGVRALLTDSIEVGPGNWTPALLDQFRRRRGYDARPWLPALIGTVVGDSARSDAFLYDYRRTLGELLAECHYGTIADRAKARGLRLYGEALEFGRPSLGDDMAMRRHASVPMAAMWTYPPADRGPRAVYRADIRGAASVAHIYGQNFVAAESLTSAWAPWAFAPADLKPMIDMEFALGVNLPVIHTSVHQPVTAKAPGLSLAIFGQHFNRLETWAEQAGPWIDYIARSAFLLQAGRSVADVLYFYGEEAPLTALFNKAPPADAPVSNDYDFANADVVLNQVTVQAGDLVTSTGQHYALLWLGGSSRRMTVAVLRRIVELVRAGATVAGIRPQRSPSLNDDAAEFGRLSKELWGDGAFPHTVGRGHVLAAATAEQALRQMRHVADFTYDGLPDTELLFRHRALTDGHIYFVTNRRDRAEKVKVQVGVVGLVPTIWRADTGTAHTVPWRRADRSTEIDLDLLPNDALFIVLRSGSEAMPIAAPGDVLATIASGWTIQFPGEAERPTTLGSWTEVDGGAARHFSGTAIYRNRIVAAPDWLQHDDLRLDFGRIGDLAEVFVNGGSAGTVWGEPWTVAIGPLLRPGVNAIEVRVTNLWVNRLIGDAQPGATRSTFTALPTYRADAPLRRAGLLAPVRVRGVRRVPRQRTQ